MADRAKPTTGKFGPTAWVLLISIVVCLISYPFKWVVAPVMAAEEYPYFAAERLISGLRGLRAEKGSWPSRLDPLVKSGSFKGLGEVVVATDGRSVEVASNVYVYFPVDADLVSVWVFPKGEYADKGHTHYLLIGKNAFRHWAGEPFDLGRVKEALRLPRPTEKQLASFRLKEVIEEPPTAKRGRWGWLRALFSKGSKEKQVDAGRGR